MQGCRFCVRGCRTTLGGRRRCFKVGWTNFGEKVCILGEMCTIGVCVEGCAVVMVFPRLVTGGNGGACQGVSTFQPLHVPCVLTLDVDFEIRLDMKSFSNIE